jgi:tRNA threonylcarbamoyladenosine biosynthesis protein TsaE
VKSYQTDNGRLVFQTGGEKETTEAAEKLGLLLVPGDVVCLYGDLGAGKTTFVKGVARALGIDDKEITSASFVIISEHDGKVPLYHIDLYRISGEEDIIDLGLEEYLQSDGVAVIEWAEKIEEWGCDFRVYFKFLDGSAREITIIGRQDRIEKILSPL